MNKEITLCVPKYVKKFLLSEPDYELLTADTLKVPRISELGHLIFVVSRHIPHTQIYQSVATGKNTEILTIQYKCKKKAFDVPVERYGDLVTLLTEQFRAAFIREIAAIHSVHPEPEYGWMVKSFLDRRGIVTSDALDKDIDIETARKIYRDHLERIGKKNSRNRRLSKPLLSGSELVCRV